MADETGRYRVVYLASVRRLLKDYCAKAKSKGIGAKTVQALLALDNHLQTDPHTFGDPWNHLGQLDLYHRIFAPFDVTYGVHKTEKHVYVRDVRPFPSDYFD